MKVNVFAKASEGDRTNAERNPIQIDAPIIFTEFFLGERKVFFDSFHPPILNVEGIPLIHDPNEDLVTCHLDYQVPVKVFEDLARFLQLLEGSRTELVRLKAEAPPSHDALESHPFFFKDYCRMRTQVRIYASDILALACREVLIPQIQHDGIELIELSPKEVLLAAMYEFHEYMREFFLTPLHAIDDLLDPDGLGHKYDFLPLSQQQVTDLKRLRSKLEPAFNYYEEFCDNNESEFKAIVYGDEKSGDIDDCSQD